MGLTSKVNERVVPISNPNLGCDPEMFLGKGGKIVESAEFVPVEGIKDPAQYSSKPAIVRDGVQVELNPAASTCRAGVVNQVAKLITQLSKDARSKGGDISFAPVVELSKEEMERLSDAARQLGCAPSLNLHDASASVVVGKDFRTRSAGGHIHIGMRIPVGMHERLVALMDVLLGNTQVMIDRDPSAAERRKTYGRAGEFRIPPHGLEYRTLSNWWLISSQMMSFVMGMTRLATHIFQQAQTPSSKPTKGADWDGFGTSLNGWDPMKALLTRMDLPKVARAINTNDLQLAKENWAIVRDFIDQHVPTMEAGLDTMKLDNFDYFLSEIESKGLKRWFPLDPVDHWSTVSEGHGVGWENWIEQCVDQVRAESKVSEMLARYR